jgi:AraC family transcriptional regulator, transcriptional activator of pobA
MLPKHPGQVPFLNIHRLPLSTHLHQLPFGDDLYEVYVFAREKHGANSPQGKQHAAGLLYCTQWKRHLRTDIEDVQDGYIIRFNKALIYSGDKDFAALYFPAFQVLSLRNDLVQLDATLLSESMRLCEMMMEESASDASFKYQVLGGFMSVLLFNLTRKINLLCCSSDDGRRFILIQRFNLLVERHFKTNKKVSDYAALMAITPNYLNLAIKKATGNSAGTHIRRRVILEAIRKVNLTGASLKEVAGDLGFNDYAHFSKFFKKGVGKNFSDVRKQEVANAGKLTIQ